MEERYKKIFVTGHRNPDLDSLCAAVCLAELRRRQGGMNIEALCPGVMPERAKYILRRFNVQEPISRGDVYVRVVDVMNQNPQTICAGTTLWEGMEMLRNLSCQQLPVLDENGQYMGMLSTMGMLEKLLNPDQHHFGALSSRAVETSINHICRVIDGEVLTGSNLDVVRLFFVYVAAMSLDELRNHISRLDNVALVVGDRPDVHRLAIEQGVPLIVVTGNLPVEADVIEMAIASGTTILRTPKDSAKAIRRMSFAAPVERFGMKGDTLVLKPNDRIRDIASAVRENFDDDIPVVNDANHLVGILSKRALDGAPPFGMILVDHNEIDQSLPGVEALPLLEIVDHHRIRTIPTDQPIKFTADVVGSTCTLVAKMFRETGESLSPSLAALLLSGLTSDTLNLKSPTTSELDVRIAAWLEKIAGVTGEQLMTEMSQIASSLSKASASDVLNADRKDYEEGGLKFALSQVEETNLQLLDNRFDEIMAEFAIMLERERLDFAALMVTDPVRLTSKLMAVGDEKLCKALPYKMLKEHVYDLPGVLSRKKQLLPQILLSIRERK